MGGSASRGSGARHRGRRCCVRIVCEWGASRSTAIKRLKSSSALRQGSSNDGAADCLRQGRGLGRKAATRARLSTRVFLADSPTQTSPGSGYASQVAANKGRVTKRNGFNYLPGRVGPQTVKVGVLRMTKDVTPSKTLYLNVVCDGGDPSKQSRVSDQLKLKNTGYIAARRFPATAFG